MDRSELTIYVGNLPWKVTEDELAELFQPFGAITGVRVIQDTRTGRSRGYGFVEFAEAELAEKAREARHGYALGGRSLFVSLAEPKPRRV